MIKSDYQKIVDYLSKNAGKYVSITDIISDVFCGYMRGKGMRAIQDLKANGRVVVNATGDLRITI